MVTIGDSSANDNIVLAAVPRKQDREPGQECHEQGRSRGLAEGVQTCGQLVVQYAAEAPAAIGLDRGPRAVRWEGEDLGHASQLGTPIGELGGEEISL